jgi:hypothetical protein
MDDDVQQEAERVDQDVPLAARDLLARIEALRVERAAPFCAALALRRLKRLERENARLKKLVAERDLEIEVMKEIAEQKW